jgi:hypothetical protein
VGIFVANCSDLVRWLNQVAMPDVRPKKPTAANAEIVDEDVDRGPLRNGIVGFSSEAFS